MAENVLMPRWRKENASHKTDRRSRKTRAALVDALMSLLKEKPLQSITVTELTELADVNRATFYIHFQDVYDMYAYVRKELCDICRDLADAHASEIQESNYDAFLADLFEYCNVNEDVFSILVDNQMDDLLFSEMTNAVHERFHDLADPVSALAKKDKKVKNIATKNPELSMRFCVYEFNYIAGGVINVLRTWFTNGRNESIETMVQVTSNLIGNATHATLKQNLMLIEK